MVSSLNTNCVPEKCQQGISNKIQSARYKNYHTVSKVSKLSYSQQSIRTIIQSAKYQREKYGGELQ